MREPRRLRRRGSILPPAFRVTIHPHSHFRLMIGRMVHAFGVDDRRPRLMFKNLRFPVIVHMKVATGAGFIITPRSASQLMGSWWLSGTVFPPRPAPVILDSLALGRRRTSARAGRRVRAERHNPHSISTLRIVLARLLLRQLPQCPYCGSCSR